MSHMSIENPRRSFEILRWMGLFATLGLPFTFGNGCLPPIRILYAVGLGLAWLTLNLMAWRRRSVVLVMLQFVIFIMGNAALVGGEVKAGTSMHLQWVGLVIASAGLPVLLARPLFMRLGLLNSYPPPFSAADRSTR